MSLRRRLAALALAGAVALTGAGCTQKSGADAIGADDLRTFADETSLAARRFRETSTIAGRQLRVEGLVEDDHRYSATVSIDGRPVYEEVVADDARYLRVLDPVELAPGGDISALVAVDPALAAATSGQWVVDPDGAPAEFVQGDRLPPVPLSPQLVLERVRFLERFDEVLAQEPREWNPDAIYYLPRDDKFEEHKDDGKRFDLVPGAYDPNSVLTTMAAIEKQFQYTSIWAKPGRITRIEQFLELPDPRRDTYKELYLQIQRAGSESLQNLVRLGERGRTLKRTFLFLPPGEAARVVVPSDAQPVDLGPALTKMAQAFAAAVKVPGPLTGRPT